MIQEQRPPTILSDLLFLNVASEPAVHAQLSCLFLKLFLWLQEFRHSTYGGTCGTTKVPIPRNLNPKRFPPEGAMEGSPRCTSNSYPLVTTASTPMAHQLVTLRAPGFHPSPSGSGWFCGASGSITFMGIPMRVSTCANSGILWDIGMCGGHGTKQMTEEFSDGFSDFQMK